MKRAVQMVLRLIAAGLIMICGLNLVLELARHWLRHTGLNIWTCLLWSVPIVLGVALFVKATALASRLSGDFDE